MFHHPKGTRIFSHNKKFKGRTTGSGYLCRLEGCSGMRLTVKWEDGRISYPCTNGLQPIGRGNSYKIG